MIYFILQKFSNDFKCDNDECVTSTVVCDGIPNCKDGSDEVECPNGS